MINAAKSALEDRIKNPILGTFFLFFMYFNITPIHTILTALGGTSFPENLINNTKFNFSSPLGYMLAYIVITSIIKIFNKWWNEVVDSLADSFADKAKGARFTENLKINNNLAKMNRELSRGISKAMANLNSMKSHVDSLSTDKPNDIAIQIGHIRGYRDKALGELENSEL